ncbi:Bug family tripartite tricarboxylate transporter substrate binding protein [Paracoccus onubensis]|uniref:Tripartite tricarboxylate transporter substrate binding protein n=1 Tax=Paracoccus onubensis TaxID=1675788 RepID=A0A418SN51_9RHOB|nr:tripartite tricarboxylate transporter substrate binding protein [Paracoccus onubensis]RJE82368.1 tripartite tricarboxylate transporter substrate binding protein [Paracoccus onubensis]
MKSAIAILSAILAATSVGSASADDTYPSKVIRMVVPFPPGGTSDFVGRVVAEQLSKDLGQTIVIENLPGAAGTIGTVNVREAKPDGYTLLLTSSDVTIVPSLQATPPYDPVEDFEPVALLLRYAHFLVASKDFPGNSIADVIELSKETPGSINYASGGIGGSNHLAGERFQSVAQIEMTHVPYNGNGPAITDLVANRVQLLWTSLAPVSGFIDTGQLKLIGTSGTERSGIEPNIPTFSESGLPGYSLLNWYGVLAPAGTPEPIVSQLNAALNDVLSNPDVLAKLAPIGATPAAETPADFSALIGEEIVSWQQIAREADLIAD